ncbi:MAG: thioredoxin-like domain-containing protein [Opitutae bacterium]
MTRLISGLLFLLLSLALLPAATLEEIAADPQLWPAEVTVTATTKARVIANGQPAGMLLLGAGKKIAVLGVAADGVTGKIGGTTVRVAADKTNLLQQPAGPAAAPAQPAANAPAAAPDEEPDRLHAWATPMQRLFAGKLVQYQNGKLGKVSVASLDDVKYYALYYSASWCGPCRQFTPGFVSTYRELKQAYPEFEVVFISADHSAADMLGYMREDKMAWPAVNFDQREQKMVEYSGPGIPCLVLVDAKGKVLADTYHGDDYLGPQQALEATRKILRKNHGS